MNSNSGIFNVSVIMVCVDPAIVNSMVPAAEKMPWLVSSSSFEAYISESRRPYFGQQAKSAHACIAVVDFDMKPELAVESTKYLQQMFPGKVTVIALAGSQNPDLILMAMRAGCSEFLNKLILRPQKLKRLRHRLRIHALRSATDVRRRNSRPFAVRGQTDAD